MSAHIGNWEVAGHFFERLGVRVSVVMYDGEHQQIKTYLNEVTGGRKFNVIVVKDDLSHVYAIGEALQNNELVCMHADRFLPGNKTIRYPLLGRDANFPIGPFALAYTFKVPVSFVFAFKETSKHYHFYGYPMIGFEKHTSRQEVIETLLNSFTKNVEELLQKYPEHWFNYYNFWEIDARG
jgi:predicted LPLAT superfamily acyltransferase